MKLLCCKIKLRKKRNGKNKKDDSDFETSDSAPAAPAPGMILTRATQVDDSNRKNNKIQILKQTDIFEFEGDEKPNTKKWDPNMAPRTSNMSQRQSKTTLEQG